ncbi:type VII secretion-associated serine protease mycosin [Mycobacteroides abscessus]|uniref:type VII secretion-associated serine protease mycosin n=1 Tax=Mycobacteroides abscessus TaxID=36809 RepID=UPI0009265594|nr:type VII secretion-associated serine protease mycosin [Mycobacteroides abscessus]MBN7333022.1 type VII secretion-associated serine protease mycosin [Mycobacteroides abscessus subsp. abscessus]SHP45911.1 type VII secretion-associated serine protease mycosin [Mycobacteroides abscessus subsp. abscessus]SIE74502.1 type VII secretion-associated serine protease mycosin [Mycobacteroides abscessus subsp. abscessus]SIG27022.1 type VII secretion-associated serine protease mycosin [Mycobacteroides absc
MYVTADIRTSFVTAVRKIAAAVAAALVLIAGSPAPAAWALSPYVFNPQVDIAPPDAPPGPKFDMVQRSLCATSGQLKGSQFDAIPIDTVWGVKKLHGFATGKGQTVAVIDTGVNRNDRLPRLLGGGDYIEGRDGLFDCDHHGTLIAGIIAAQPAAGDGFVGMAPDATIVSIRQTSAAYEVDSAKLGNAREAQSASTVATLAESIVHAATLNASVINISVTACVATSKPVELRALAGALYYAAVVKNAVIVTAAGNLGGDCTPNPDPNPAHPEDVRGWNGVTTISLPSMFEQFVLSVGGTTLTGDPYIKSMSGPWVGVAAPAINVVSIDPAKLTGELINAQQTKDGIEPIAGTSFAAANVSGLATLIRERYPNLTSHQVIERIKRTAHKPSQAMSSLVGAGVVDPMQALAAPVDDSIPTVAEGVPPVAAVPDAPGEEADTLGQTIGYIALAVFAAVVFIVLVVSIARSGRGVEKL